MALNVQPLSPTRRGAMILVMALLLASSLGFAQALIHRAGRPAPARAHPKVHFLPPPGEKEMPVNTVEDVDNGTIRECPVKLADGMRHLYAFDWEMEEAGGADRYFRMMLDIALADPAERPVSVHATHLGPLDAIEGGYRVGRGVDSSFVIGRATVLDGHVLGFCFSGDGLMTDADKKYFNDYCEQKIELK